MILKLNMCRLRGNDERDWGPAGAPPPRGYMGNARQGQVKPLEAGDIYSQQKPNMCEF